MTTATAATTVIIHSQRDNETSTDYMENFKPRYLKVSDRVFKQILSNAIENGFTTIRCLNTPEKLQFVRRLTEITNDFYFKELQRQLWQEYHKIALKQQRNGSFRTTKKYSHEHNTCQIFIRSKDHVEKRQKVIQREMELKGNELANCVMQLQQNTEHWQPSIDSNVLSNVINECVKHGQQRLRDEFNYKKEMLTLDWSDHHSIEYFYQLKPDDELVKLAKGIWQTTADEFRTKEQQEILRQLIYLKRLPTKTDQIVNHPVDDNQITLFNPFLEPDQRASFASRCSKTIIQCKFNLMIAQLDEFGAVIRRHQLSLTSLQEKLSKLHQENPQLHTNSLLDVIETRRQAMINRFYRIRQYKLKSFFDEAPAVNSDNSN